MASFTAFFKSSSGSSRSSSNDFFKSIRESGRKHGLSVCALQLMDFSSAPVRASFRKLAASTPTYDMSRGLAKVAVDFMCSVNSDKERSHLLKTVVQGTVMNNLEADADVQYHYMLGADAIILRKIYYCQERLFSVPTLRDSMATTATVSTSVADEDQIRRAKSIVNHDSIVLEICVPMRSKAAGLKVYVRAEKVGRSDKGAGILINWEKEEVDKRCTVFHVDCNEKRLSFKDLEAVLEAANPNYSLKHSCCWDYAKETVESVLRLCQKQGDTSEEERNRLEEEIRTISERISVSVVDNALDDMNDFVRILIHKVAQRTK